MRVEARILFRLELPSHKSIGVKAKQGKTVEEVARLILMTMMMNWCVVFFLVSMIFVILFAILISASLLPFVGWMVPPTSEIQSQRCFS